MHFERFQRRESILAFGYDLQFRPQTREHRAQLIALRRFILGKNGADRIHGVAAVLNCSL
jgi:hypothetical protein